MISLAYNSIVWYIIGENHTTSLRTEDWHGCHSKMCRAQASQSIEVCFQNKRLEQPLCIFIWQYAKICCKWLVILKLFFATKMLKMTISTSVWSGQHPNAGQNIQQPYISNLICPSVLTTENLLLYFKCVSVTRTVIFHNKSFIKTTENTLCRKLIFLNWFTVNLPTKKCSQLHKARWSDYCVYLVSIWWRQYRNKDIGWLAAKSHEANYQRRWRLSHLDSFPQSSWSL